MTAVVAASIATICVFVTYGFARRVARDRLLSLQRDEHDQDESITAIVVVCACAVGYLFGVVAALVTGIACIGFALARRSMASHRALEGARSAAVELVAAFAGELRAGRPLPRALQTAVEDAGPLRAALQPVTVAAQTGGDIATELRIASDTTGIAALRAVAACCAVTAHTGAPLASTLDHVASGLRAEQQLRDEARAQLAGPRTTAYLLAALPVFGVVLAGGLGAHPITVLLQTPIGGACLAAGATLDFAGVCWMRRLLRAAEP